MKTKLALLGLVSVFGTVAVAAPKIGAAAPNFSLVDSVGKKHTLEETKGKWVVLEWLNHGCPFVRKHYDSGNMQGLQKKYTGKGVVWYSVISSAPGKQGHASPSDTTAEAKKNSSAATAILLDPEGTVGRSYGAMTTPHMYLIDPKGTLVYQGAIDDKPTTDVADVTTAHNYVSAALDSAMAGKPVAKASTKAYGCSVKYLN